MAVQILNDMPDAAIHRGDPFSAFGVLKPERGNYWNRPRFGGRAGFVACTVALHFAAFIALVSVRHDRVASEPEPMLVALLESPAADEEKPPEYVPPPQEIVYALPVPPEMSFETDAITPPVVSTAITESASQTVAPVIVDSVEYVRPPAPVYPSESNRRRERGTVVLRVMVDTFGRPAQIQIERSSGFTRLDSAARQAVEKALFRPYEVNGIAQPAQVLVPIEFTRRAT